MPTLPTRMMIALALTPVVVIARPAPAAAEATVQVVSAGSASAVGKYLTISNVTFKNIDAAPITSFTVRSELVTGSSFVSPTFVFDADPHVVKSGCQVDDSVQRRAIDCVRFASVAAGATYKFSFTNVITMSVGGGDQTLPSVKVTISAGGGSDSQTTGKVTHSPPSTDLSATVSPVTGAVGSTVSVAWKVTNRGPHEMPRRQLMVIVVPPVGTRWTATGSAYHCDTAAGGQYRCTVYRTLPAGQSVSDTWQLTIDSPPSGAGEIRVEVDPYTVGGSGPVWLAVDPDGSNNVARFAVTAVAGQPAGGTTSSAAPVTSAVPTTPTATEPPPGAPSVAYSTTVTTSRAKATNSALVVGAGVASAVVVAGALTAFLFRRRRQSLPTTTATSDTSEASALGE